TPSLDPFSPHNPLIFGAGLLTGILGFGSRVSITSKSPESGHLGDANMGGEFGAELVKAGFSHLVITGRSPKPAYLFIRDGEVEIRSAQTLRGCDTVETQQKIRALLGDDRLQTACIGPAGENRVRYAAIRSGLKSAAARTGMGAVMGSKNLKAVTVRGTRDIRISDPKKYLSYYRRQLRRLMQTNWVQALGKQGTPLLFGAANAVGFLSVRNNQFTSVGEQGYRLEAEALEPFSNGMVACHACPVHCRHRFVIEAGPYKGTRGEGPEYASIGSLGTKLGNLDLENIITAVERCNRYGLDTISAGSYIAWAMELYQHGILDRKITGIPLAWGNGKSILKILEMIAHRKGFGDILAEGSFARDRLGDSSRDYLMEIKGLPIEMTDERLPKSFALGLATSTRGACHMRSRPSMDALGLPQALLKKIYGGPVSNRMASYSGKGRMVWWHELLHAVTDALGVCRFLTAFSSPHGLQYRQFARLIKHSTGLEMSSKQLRTIAERIYTLERMMLVGDGISRKDDTLPKRYFEEPIPEGPAKGSVIDITGFDRMLDENYRLHGWDRDGIPTKRTLKRLGITI
ncbi:MAG: aldehyde ferredoxin oxidoreductase family protein, partial [Deltaproteobacteria bacterium]|nr:aldehyde ferredoxin oxidoreductase family protein [Deltaproteobacteria bacterium]